MRRILLSAVLFLASCVAAMAMSASSAPTKFPVPWGNSATCGTPYTANCYITNPVPTNSQVGVVNCAASLQTGFPPLTWPVPGGCPPFGQDFNGILYQLSAWAQWLSAGAPIKYDSTFQTAIGGYPQGAVISSAATAGLYWLSLVDNNTSNPDSGGANWQGLGVGVPTGTLMPFAGSTAPTGYFLCYGQAVSRTTYAALFAVIGTTYGTGDGSTTFNLPDLRGRTALGQDNMGGVAANRVTSGGSGCNAVAEGTGCGAQNQTIAQGNFPNVNFSFSLTAQPQTASTSVGGVPQTAYWGSGTQGLQGGGAISAPNGAGAGSITNSTSSVTGSISSGGSGTPLTTLPPAQVVTYIIKF